MKEFMTPHEYAEFAGITAKTITELKKEGFLPIIQVSKQKYLINVGKMMRDQEAERLKMHEAEIV
jgi:predicted site-specific integrase-resolvase